MQAEPTARKRKPKPRQPCKRCGGPKEPGRRRSLCDSCQDRAAVELLPESRRKPCKRCGRDKGPGRRRRYCDACQETANRDTRLAAKRRDWERHGDKRRASKRKNYAENAERLRAVAREYYAAHPERYAENQQRWIEENPERWLELKREREARRRARKRGVPTQRIESLVVLEMYDGLCGICGTDVDVMNFHLDHIWPLALGGEHSYANLQPAHPSCNMRKGWSA